eukprot:Gb_40229 [translate_table: standard]
MDKHLVGCYHIPNFLLEDDKGGALRDRSISAQPQTPDQCELVGPFPFLRDLSDIARLDPSPGGRRDPLGLSGELPPPDSNAVDNPDLLPVLPLDIILFLVSFIRPRMLGEMSSFHDRPTSLLLYSLGPRAPTPVHIQPRASPVLMG